MLQWDKCLWGTKEKNARQKAHQRLSNHDGDETERREQKVARRATNRGGGFSVVFQPFFRRHSRRLQRSNDWEIKEGCFLREAFASVEDA